MADFKERRFSIDPGKGKKMDGCPYSVYEDGRDVKDYIIPPKGHVFVGFKFDPDASNQIYDGKLIAEYAKESINERLKSNLWKAILALAIILIVTIVALLAANVFKEPKPDKPSEKPKAEVQAETTKQETTSTETTAETKTEAETTGTISVDEVETAQAEMKTQQEEQNSPMADDPNTQFRNEFWALIHTRTIMMDPYDALYKSYKDKANGEEFDYLRYTVLKDYPTFKGWYTALKKVPTSELEKINTIEGLKQSLKETY